MRSCLIARCVIIVQTNKVPHPCRLNDPNKWCFYPVATLPTYAVVTFRKDRPKSNFAQVAVGYICAKLHRIYIHGSPVEIQTHTHCNMIGHSVIAPALVFSSSSILSLFLLISLSFPQGKIRCAFKNFHSCNYSLYMLKTAYV
jgi:hypothetical protein